MAALADDIRLEYPIESPIPTLESSPGMPIVSLINSTFSYLSD